MALPKPKPTYSPPEQMSLPWLDQIYHAMQDSNVRRAFPGNKLNSWHIGGSVDCVVDMESDQDLFQLCHIIHQHHLPWRILGKGSNVLIPDAGLRGVTIRLGQAYCQIEMEKAVKNNNSSHEARPLQPTAYHNGASSSLTETSLPHIAPPMSEYGHIWTGAGTSNAALVKFCQEKGWGGLEFLGVIPGSIGGSIVNNSGAHGVQTVECITHLTMFDARWIGQANTAPTNVAELFTTVEVDPTAFTYRHSPYRHQKGWIILKALWKSRQAPLNRIKTERQALLNWRRSHQPRQYPNCGSVFKNPAGDFAARLIEQAGFKGKRYGDAQISNEHANFIVNLQKSTAEDVMVLIDEVISGVRRHTGIELELEMQVLTEE